MVKKKVSLFPQAIRVLAEGEETLRVLGGKKQKTTKRFEAVIDDLHIGLRENKRKKKNNNNNNLWTSHGTERER